MALKLDYVSRETLINLRRNLLLTTASMVTVAVSLSMVGGAFLLRYGVDNATQRWKNGVEFEVFMNLDATPEQKARIERLLVPSANPDVRDVRFISRQEQFDFFKDFANDVPAYDVVGVEDLPESYRVAPRVDDADVIRAMADRLAQEPGVREVAFAGDQVERAFRTSSAFQRVMIGLAVVLFVASSLLIFNTIRMAIFARRREIEVMKLVGATNWFIRVPFMVEGLVQGVAGATAAFTGIYFLREPMTNFVTENFDHFDGFLVRSGDVVTTGIFVLVLGSLLGAISAGVAVTRFLDV